MRTFPDTCTLVKANKLFEEYIQSSTFVAEPELDDWVSVDATWDLNIWSEEDSIPHATLFWVENGETECYLGFPVDGKDLSDNELFGKELADLNDAHQVYLRTYTFLDFYVALSRQVQHLVEKYSADFIIDMIAGSQKVLMPNHPNQRWLLASDEKGDALLLCVADEQEIYREFFSWPVFSRRRVILNTSFENFTPYNKLNITLEIK